MEFKKGDKVWIRVQDYNREKWYLAELKSVGRVWVTAQSLDSFPKLWRMRLSTRQEPESKFGQATFYTTEERLNREYSFNAFVWLRAVAKIDVLIGSPYFRDRVGLARLLGWEEKRPDWLDELGEDADGNG